MSFLMKIPLNIVAKVFSDRYCCSRSVIVFLFFFFSKKINVLPYVMIEILTSCLIANNFVHVYKITFSLYTIHHYHHRYCKGQSFRSHVQTWTRIGNMVSFIDEIPYST